MRSKYIYMLEIYVCYVQVNTLILSKLRVSQITMAK